MIVDSLSNTQTYLGISKLLDIGINFLNTTDMEKLKVGNYELTDGVFYLVQEYQTKNIDEVKFESHRKYIDIQYLPIGSEDIFYCDKKYLITNTPYVEDIEFYNDCEKSEKITLDYSNFAIFFPQDAHKPCINNGCQNAKKIVIKIPML